LRSLTTLIPGPTPGGPPPHLELDAANDPLRHEERRSYVSAILDAVGGLGTARDVLAYVRQRRATEDATAA
jgi:hypothetical protein